MAYTKLNIKDGEVLTAAHLAHIESGIVAADTQSDLIAHINNKSNPHKVTKEQIGLNEVENIRQYSTNNPPIAIQSTAPSDTSLIWVDTSDDFEEDVTNIEDRIIERIKALSSLPHGGSKEWLDKNGDKTQLYQIDGYIWGYIESDGWTKSGTQFLVVSDEADMTNEGGTRYLLRSGSIGTVYSFVEASGDTNIPVYDTLPETANSGDIVAVAGRKYKASLTTSEVPNYTNLLSQIQEDVRYKSDGTVVEEVGTTICLDYIPFTNGTVVRIKGFKDLKSKNTIYYDANKNVYSGGRADVATTHNTYAYDSSTGIVTLTSISDKVSYIRLQSSVVEGDIIITANEEIANKTVTTTTWTDIGEYIQPVEAGWNSTDDTYSIIDSLTDTASNGSIAVYSIDGYVYSYISGADWMSVSKYAHQGLYVDNILSNTSANAVQNKIITVELDGIKESVRDNMDNIITLQNKVESLNTGSSSEIGIPSYWGNAISEKTDTIKALQIAGGKDCISFAWASDPHIPDNDDGRTTDIGKLMAKMLDNCQIPFALLTGDINSRASFKEEASLVDAQNQMQIHLAPLWGTDRLLMALGNHDGCYGDSSGYYRKQFKPERMWNIFFRSQALDFRRVFSDDGLYYYVDNVAQKTRFIVLNSHFGGEYAENSNGWAVNNRFGTSCYGQEQLDWLADVALNMPDGYDAIIFAHVPPNINYTVDKAQFIGIVNAYNNKTLYTGSYTGISGWTSSNVSVDFTDANGEIIAMFTGHVHGDSIDTTTMTCPILTILSAGASANDPYKDEAPTRKAGTDTETSFDVVTINKNTRTIHCTRIGAGSDRETIY